MRIWMLFVVGNLLLQYLKLTETFVVYEIMLELEDVAECR